MGLILRFSFVVVQLGSLSGVQNQRAEDSMQHDAVDQLELQFYETQLDLYDTKFEILKNEEQLLVAQIDTLRRQIKGIYVTSLPQTNRFLAGYSVRMSFMTSLLLTCGDLTRTLVVLTPFEELTQRVEKNPLYCITAVLDPR